MTFECSAESSCSLLIADTEDWKLGAGTVNATTAYDNIERFMNLGATEMDTGFIVLEHDLYQQSVDLAVSYILPQAINEGKLKLLPVNECLGESKANACEHLQLLSLCKIC